MKKNFYSVALFATILALPLFAHSYSKHGNTLKISPLRDELLKAHKVGLSLSRNEGNVKNEIESMKKLNERRFIEMLADPAANPPEYQSYLYEVRDGRNDIEKAKLIAARHLYLAIQNNWSELKNTVINEIAASRWKTFEGHLRQKLKQLLYQPVVNRKKDEKTFKFKLADWGQVTLKKSKVAFKSIHWQINATTVHDENQMPPEAESIVIEQ